jgi:hypothetical protein
MGRPEPRSPRHGEPRDVAARRAGPVAVPDLHSGTGAAGSDSPAQREAAGVGQPDRVVRAALRLVLEPIFEADFQPACLLP